MIRSGHLLHFIGSEVHLVRRAIVKALVRPARIVKIEIIRKRGFQLTHRLVGVQIEVLVLDASPQPLDEHIIDPTPLAVHAHAHALGLQRLGEVIGGELAALVGVEDLEGTVARERLLQGLDTEIRAHRIADPNAQHLAAVEIQDRHQVDKPLGHRQVRDVRRPRLAGPLNGDVCEQVGVIWWPFAGMLVRLFR